MSRRPEQPPRTIDLPFIEQAILDYSGIEAGMSVGRSSHPAPRLDVYGNPEHFTHEVTPAGSYKIRQISSTESSRHAEPRPRLVLALPHTLGLSSAKISTLGGDINVGAIRTNRITVNANARRGGSAGTIHASGLFAVRATFESVNRDPDTVTIMDSSFGDFIVTAPESSLFIDGSYAEQWTIRTLLADSSPGDAPKQEIRKGALNNFSN